MRTAPPVLIGDMWDRFPLERFMSARDAALLDDTPRSETSPPTLHDRLGATRQLSTDLTRPLSDEEQVVQAKDDASRAKWHLVHTNWFFEAFVLKPFLQRYRVFDESFEYCFNSYYESVGP